MRSNFLTNTFNQLSNYRIPSRRNSTLTAEKTTPPRRPRLMCVLAHPDDESLCVGGTLARYAAQGVEISLVVATRGERGWRGAQQDNPGLLRLGEIREAEVRAAARVLGVTGLHFLDYLDGDVSTAPFDDLVTKIAAQVRHFRPDVVITFDPHGMYGHPDHLAISQATTNALWRAADPAFHVSGALPPYRAAKLYYRVFSQNALKQYQEIFGELKMKIAGEQRIATAWQPWAMTTRIEVQSYVAQVWAAIACHRSQMQITDGLRARFREYQTRELGTETYYRVFSPGKSSRAETDLFSGLQVWSDLMTSTQAKIESLESTLWSI